MKVLSGLLVIFICCTCSAESIFIVGQPYSIANTDYTNGEACQLNEDCVQMVWYSEYKLKNVISLSGKAVGKKVTFVMASHSQRFENGSKSNQKWFVELAPIKHSLVKYEAVNWSPIEEIVCTEKLLKSEKENLESYWKSVGENEFCYSLQDLLEAKKIKNE